MDDFETISMYTRGQALADGILVDVTRDAAEAGISVPVAVTLDVWERYVKIPDGVTYQDEGGRLWDIVWMLRSAITKMPRSHGNPVLPFSLHVRNDNRNETPPLVTLHAHCDSDDDGNMCLTVTLPEED